MKKQIVVALALAFAFLVSPAHAGTIVEFQAGTTASIGALTGFSTTGDMMAGMLFTITDQQQNVTTGAWQPSGPPGCGGVSGPGWSLHHCGDTFTEPWVLSTSSGVSRILIDALAGASVFDITFTGFGTEGSAAGLSFGLEGETALNITATYSGQVALGDAQPVGDLYRFLQIDFEQPIETESFMFGMDIDSIAVPEPSMLALLGAGLYAALRSRRRRTS
jgi:hypothetical protein